MESFKSTAYTYLKDLILTCKLKPNDVIDQTVIMKELGVSRTPVREAIAALEQEHLVTIFPRRGVVVTGISANEISNISVVRGLLEPYFTRLAASTADHDKLEEFLVRFGDNSDLITATKADFEFHMYLASLSNNNFLIQTMDQVLSSNMRLVILAAGLPNRLPISNSEHRDIVQALLDRDADKAEAMMRLHLNSATESSIESTRTFLL